MKKLYYFSLLTYLISTQISCVSAKKYRDLQHEKSVHFADKVNSEQELNRLKNRIGGLQRDTLTLGENYRSLTEKYTALEKANTLSVQKMETALKNNKNQLKQQENSLKKQVVAKDKTLKEKQAVLDNIELALAKDNERKEKAKKALVAATKQYTKNEVSIKEVGPNLRILISDQLLFEAGNTQLNEETNEKALVTNPILTKKGKKALAKIAEPLNKQQDISLTVVGHTDNSPVTGVTFVDNWDVSVRRATAVVRSLTKDFDMEAKQIIAAGHGEYFPITSNQTPEGQAKNRRTEIIVTFDNLENIEVLVSPEELELTEEKNTKQEKKKEKSKTKKTGNKDKEVLEKIEGEEK